MKTIIVVGNPRAGSRTRQAAERVAQKLGAASVEVIELSELGADLFDWKSETVAGAVAAVQQADLAIVASPTFKASYTGLLKLFLDRFEGGKGMAGVTAVPLMLGGDMGHSLAPEAYLRPVLSEIGAACPAAALYLVDSTWNEDPRLDIWIERWKPVIRRCAGK